MTFDVITVIVLGVVFAATLMQSTFGFGSALVAMPLLPLVVDFNVARALVAWNLMTVAVIVVARDWRQIQFRTDYKLTLFGLIGIPLGAFGLIRAPDAFVKILLALIVIGFALFRLLDVGRFHLKTDHTGWLFGLGAGILGGAYNTPGPPLVIYGTLRDWPQDRFRATLQGYFIPNGAVILAVHCLAGLWVEPVFRYYLLSLPILLAALLLGRVLHQRFSVRRFFRFVYLILILLGVNLIVQAL